MEGYKTNYRVLIADDDPNVHQSLSPYFRREGYEIFSSYDGEDAVEKARSLKPDMIILDIMMPRKDGLAVCREIRREANIPVIMLSAKGEEFDKLLGLELGADDYISKPFRVKELQARIKSVLRRYKTGTPDGTVQLRNLEIRTGEAKVYKNGEEIILTAMEYRLLLILLNNRGRVLSRTALLENIWDVDGDFVNDNTLTVYIKRLRDKIEDNPDSPSIIKTVRGMGYVIADDEPRL